MKSMKMTLVGLFGAGIALLTVGSVSASTSYFTHGSNCFLSSGGPVTYGQFGVNPSTSASATIMCPIPDAWKSLPFGTPFSLGVGAYDRSSTANVACSLVMTDGYGDINSIVSGNTVGNSVSEGGFTLSGTTAGFTYFTCSLPGQTSSGFSHLTGYTPTL